MTTAVAAPLLRVEGARKSYPGVQALAGVDFEVNAGEVHALLGENGAGKSTLMKVMAGSVEPNQGTMTLNGEQVPFGSPQAALGRGIGIVYQDLSLVPTLSIAENVLLGRWPRSRIGLVNLRGMHAVARPHAERAGLHADTRTVVARLGTAERQLTEIAKALSRDVRVLLLDEPTSALSDRESHHLFDVIRDLAASGVGIVYVSHRLPEVLEIADRITVLRDGAKVGTVYAQEASQDLLARMMVGRTISGPGDEAPAAEDENHAEVVLQACGLGRPPRLRDVDLTLRRGQIVAVFGLVGAGRTRLARTLFGLEPATTGTLEVGGRRVHPRSPADAVAVGIGYVSEDRAAGLVPRLPVAANITLAALEQISTGPLLDRRAEQQLATRYVKRLEIRTPSIDRLVETLSGGNKQKVLLARWMCSGARILVLDDPTRGVDVGAKEEVFGLVREVAANGVAVLYLTSEIWEAQALSDQIIVMAGGRVVETFPPSASEDAIMSAAGGVRG